MHFVSCQMKLDLHVLILFMFCSNSERHRSIFDWMTPKCVFTVSIIIPWWWPSGQQSWLKTGPGFNFWHPQTFSKRNCHLSAPIGKQWSNFASIGLRIWHHLGTKNSWYSVRNVSKNRFGRKRDMSTGWEMMKGFDPSIIKIGQNIWGQNSSKRGTNTIKLHFESLQVKTSHKKVNNFRDEIAKVLGSVK